MEPHARIQVFRVARVKAIPLTSDDVNVVGHRRFVPLSEISFFKLHICNAAVEIKIYKKKDTECSLKVDIKS